MPPMMAVRSARRNTDDVILRSMPDQNAKSETDLVGHAGMPACRRHAREIMAPPIGDEHEGPEQRQAEAAEVQDPRPG